MITTDQISNPIRRFNAIKHIAQTTDDKLVIKLFQTSFDQANVTRIQTFFNLLQTPDSVETTVNVKGKNAVVPAKEKRQLFQQDVLLNFSAKLILKTFHIHNQ